MKVFIAGASGAIGQPLLKPNANLTFDPGGWSGLLLESYVWCRCATSTIDG
jgi:hypothetical protein